MIDRRQFLERAGTALGSFLAMNSGTEPVTNWIDTALPHPVPINRTAVEATVTDRSSTSVTVTLRSTRSRTTVRPVAYIREFPAGRLLARAASEAVTLKPQETRSVTLSVGVPVGALADRWFYEVRDEPVESAARETSYLCESDPVGGELAEPAGPSDRLTTDEGRYERTFEWSDRLGHRWHMPYAVSKSRYHSVRDRTTDYLRSYAGAQRSPYAAHVAELFLSAQAVTESREASAYSKAQRQLERAVGFVQSFEYAADLESLGRLEYIRSVEESLVDGAGDCKDGTILLAGLLSQPPFEYETALVFMPSHLLLGVHRADLPPAYQNADTVEDSPFVPIETTDRSPIGAVRDETIVAIVGTEYREIDVSAVDDVLATQLSAFASDL